MARHRGKYKKYDLLPYELSRSRVENFIKCPACFYLQQVKGVRFPSIPGFNLNEATDVLLKRDFDKYRGKSAHPYLKSIGFENLVPYSHQDFELWTQSLHFGAEGRMNFVHQPTNLKVGGGLDDVWIDTNTKKLHVVDYKSTSQKSPGREIDLNDKWKAAYKRQMDFYVWVMLQQGFDVSSTGYFLYCDGDRFSDYTFLNNAFGNMKFKMTLIPYEVDISWVEPTLYKIKECLELEKQPEHSQDCEFRIFLDDLLAA